MEKKMDRAGLSAVLAEMRREKNILPYADRIEEAVRSLFEDIRSLCQAEIDSYISDHISAIFMLKVVRESVDDQLRRLSQGKEANDERSH